MVLGFLEKEVMGFNFFFCLAEIGVFSFSFRIVSFNSTNDLDIVDEQFFCPHLQVQTTSQIF